MLYLLYKKNKAVFQKTASDVVRLHKSKMAATAQKRLLKMLPRVFISLPLSNVKINF